MNTVPCILIVDDQKDFAEGIAELLEMKGYKAQVAFSAMGALERAGAVDVAVALIDLRLGHASGLDLIEGLKSIRPGILCLIMTAYADVDTAIEAVHRGAYDYLRKPLSTGDLLLTLNRCLDRIRLEEEKKTSGSGASGKESGTFGNQQPASEDGCFHQGACHLCVSDRIRPTSSEGVFAEYGGGGGKYLYDPGRPAHPDAYSGSGPQSFRHPLSLKKGVHPADGAGDERAVADSGS